jgi:hypothetical protein
MAWLWFRGQLQEAHSLRESGVISLGRGGENPRHEAVIASINDALPLPLHPSQVQNSQRLLDLHHLPDLRKALEKLVLSDFSPLHFPQCLWVTLSLSTGSRKCESCSLLPLNAQMHRYQANVLQKHTTNGVFFRKRENIADFFISSYFLGWLLSPFLISMLLKLVFPVFDKCSGHLCLSLSLY